MKILSRVFGVAPALVFALDGNGSANASPIIQASSQRQSIWFAAERQMKRISLSAITVLMLCTGAAAQQSFETEITNQPLRIILNFADKGASQATDHIINSSTPQSLRAAIPMLYLAVSLPVRTALSTTSMGTLFNGIWTNTLPGSQQSLHDIALSQMSQQIAKAGCPSNCQVSKVESISLPSTGWVGAISGLPTDGPLTPPSYGPHQFFPAQLQGLRIDYLIQGASAIFDAGPLSASWKLTFDIDVALATPYSLVPCNFNLAPITAQIENVNISPNNTGASVDQTLGNAVLALQDQPANIFQGAIGQISAQSETIKGSPINALFSGLSSVCLAELDVLGFTQFLIFTDASSNSLNFRFTHPLGNPPVLFLKGSGPSLFHAMITIPESEVSPGAHFAVTGEDFNINTSQGIVLSWTDNSPGAWTQPNVRATPGLGNAKTSTGNGTYTITDPAPNTNYTFQVQDCNAFTCTPWSNTLQVKTGASNAGTVQLVLLQGSNSIPVGSAVVGASGGFSTTVTVASTVAPGTYTLAAQRGGQTLASVQLTVAGQKGLQARIDFVDPTTGRLSTTTRATTGANLTVQGQGFNAGAVKLTLDKVNGTTIATANATGSPPVFKITFPVKFSGQHTIIASQSAGGNKNIEASATVTAEQIQ